jgi:hypothetical protein
MKKIEVDDNDYWNNHTKFRTKRWQR